MQRDNERISALTAEIDKLQAELGYEQEDRELTLKMTTNCIDSKDEDAEEIVNKHIRLLHSYNEAKDATQVYWLVASSFCLLLKLYGKIILGKVCLQRISSIEIRLNILWVACRTKRDDC